MVEPVPLLILLGPPASGKTTLGRRLASELRLPFYSRDDFKERLFDSLGWSDRAWSRRLGMASWELFWQVIATQLAAGQATIVETNFRHPRDSERFQRLASRFPLTPLQINCVTRGDVLIERHRARSSSGERHPGHVDHLASVQAELLSELLAGRSAPLDLGGQVIELDTTDFAAIDHARLLATIHRLLPGL
ncbi:MAG TPA: AAA family ATPase [Thermomicrobiaceae bacterium]|nr:AAA family ATPase [Thermomicrobiaceae bacterium]